MPSLSNWMSLVPDNTSLSDISMPGAHDCATYTVRSIILLDAITARGIKFVQCQDLDIQAQLEAGVRFLDIRVKLDSGGDFLLYHGIAPLGLTLKTVLDSVGAFLKAQPTETVITSIKLEDEDNRSEIGKQLVTFLKTHAKDMFVDTKIPLLKDVRGRMVLFNRVFETPSGGIFLYFNDNQIFEKTQVQSDGTSLTFAVQDIYSPQAAFLDSNLTEKIKAIEEGYKKHSPTNAALRIAFASASSFPTRTPGEYAESINPMIEQMLFDHTKGAAWITVLDYVGTYGKGRQNPIAAIVSANILTGARPNDARDALTAGHIMRAGDELWSSSGAYRATFQADGNFVVYRTIDNEPIAASDSPNRSGDRITLQDDGNLVVYAGTNPLAATGTDGKGGTRMVMQDDGNLVIYDAASKAVWGSRQQNFHQR